MFQLRTCEYKEGLNSPEGAPDNSFFDEFFCYNLNAEGCINERRCVESMYVSQEKNPNTSQNQQVGRNDTGYHEIGRGDD